MEKLSIKAFSNIGTIKFIRKLVAHGKTHIFLVVQILRVKRGRVVVFAVGHVRVEVVLPRKRVSFCKSTYSRSKNLLSEVSEFQSWPNERRL